MEQLLSFQSNFRRLCDYFVPDGLKIDPHEYFLAKLLVGICLSLSVLVGIYGLVVLPQFGISSLRVSSLFVASVALLCIPFVLKRFKSTQIGACLFIAFGMLIIPLPILGGGDVMSNHVEWFLLLVVCACWFLKPWLSALFLVAISLELLGLFSMTASQVSAVGVMVLPYQVLWLKLVVLTVILFCCWLTFFLYSRQHGKLRANLQRQLEEDQRLALLFRSSSEPYFIFSQQGLIDSNTAAKTMIGAEDKTGIEKFLRHVASVNHYSVGGMILDRFEACYDEASKKGSLAFETVIRQQDSSLSILAKVTPGKLNGNNVLLMHWQDLSDIKKSHVGLIKAQKEALEANRLKTRLLETLSFEIRNPLNAMVGLAEMLREGELNQEQRISMKELLHLSHQLNSVVNDILDYSKIESQRIELQDHSFDLHQCLEMTISSYLGESNARSIDIDLQISEQVPQFVRCDEARLKQIINHLLQNSFDHTVRGHIGLSVQAKAYDSDQVVEFKVTDTGCGMDAKILGRVFQPYKLNRRQSNGVRRGSGLGLAICKGLVESMGGAIDLTSQVGQGTEVTFSIKMAPGHSLGGEIDGDSLSESYHLENNRFEVLVVDDDELTRETIVRQLMSLGIDVDVAENGRDGLQKMRSRSFDICILDCQMPGIDGFQTTQIVRSELPSYRQPYIIALTAQDGAQKKCLEAGMDDYIRKPFSANLLVKAIERVANSNKVAEIIELERIREKRVQRLSGLIPGSELSTIVNSYFDGDFQFFEEMLSKFIELSQQNMEKLYESLKSNNIGGQVAILHTQKGMCLNLGWEKFAKRISSLEEAVFADNALTDTEVNQLETDLLVEVDRFRDKLMERKTG